MGTKWRARNVDLLDALERLEPTTPFVGQAWRTVREGRNPLIGHPSAGRWDPGIFDVLYTSLDAQGCIAEISFHLARQPVIPSKINFVLHSIKVHTKRTLTFFDLKELIPFGVEPQKYESIL